MCPPGVDQTTRSKQRWQILAPRLRARYANETLIDGIRQQYPGCIFATPWSAWRNLAKATPVHLRRQRPTCRPIRQLNQAQSRLESLPPELIALVCADSVLQHRDILALGCASDGLWRNVLQHVTADCVRREGPLAGVEIACMGTYLTTLPPAFVKDGFMRSTLDLVPIWGLCEARQIMWNALRAYDEVPKSAAEEWLTAWQRVEEGWEEEGGVAEMLKKELLAAIEIEQDAEKGHEWVLRNLTTNEYVRCHADEVKGVRCGVVEHGDFRISLDDVLLMRISWGGITSSGWWPPQEKHRRYAKAYGSWAGHCFDIVSLERHRKTETESEWTDVTAQVLEVGADAVHHNPFSKRPHIHYDAKAVQVTG